MRMRKLLNDSTERVTAPGIIIDTYTDGSTGGTNLVWIHREREKRTRSPFKFERPLTWKHRIRKLLQKSFHKTCDGMDGLVGISA